MKFLTVHTDNVQRAICVDSIIYIERCDDGKALIYLQAGVKSQHLLKSDEDFNYLMDVLSTNNLI